MDETKILKGQLSDYLGTITGWRYGNWVSGFKVCTKEVFFKSESIVVTPPLPFGVSRFFGE